VPYKPGKTTRAQTAMTAPNFPARPQRLRERDQST
jgi:hypothetical protein